MNSLQKPLQYMHITFISQQIFSTEVTIIIALTNEQVLVELDWPLTITDNCCANWHRLNMLLGQQEKGGLV